MGHQHSRHASVLAMAPGEKAHTGLSCLLSFINKSIKYPDFKWWQLMHIKKRMPQENKKQNPLLPGWWDTSLQPLSQCL